MCRSSWLCRKMGMLAKGSVAIDGSKFKAVNNRDKNFTKVERRRTQLEQSIARYLAQLDTADRQERSETIELKKTRLREKLTKLKSEPAKLEAIEKQLLAKPDQQISLTDPDSRSMATSGRGSGVVGYNVQTAVDTENHLIVAHEVSNVGTRYGNLTPPRRIGGIMLASPSAYRAIANHIVRRRWRNSTDAGSVRPSNQERRSVPVLSTLDLAECVLKDDFIVSESKKVASSGRYQLAARSRRNKVPLKRPDVAGN